MTDPIPVLLAVAERAGRDCTSTHPEDIGHAMSHAVEVAAMVLDVLREGR